MEIDDRVEFRILESISERICGHSNDPTRIPMEYEIEVIICAAQLRVLPVYARNVPTCRWLVSNTPHRGIENGKKNFLSGVSGTLQFQLASYGPSG